MGRKEGILQLFMGELDFSGLCVVGYITALLERM